ncbi:MAG TPA: hypothetical protein ENG68_03145 [bacterium]|nr:hypothetical protein [bacterium]
MRAILILLLTFSISLYSREVVVNVKKEVILHSVPRIGLNVSGRVPKMWHSWVLINCYNNNPGMEGIIHRFMVEVSKGGSDWFEEVKWAKYPNFRKELPDGYWNGCRYVVMYGNSYGRKGIIKSYKYVGNKKSKDSFKAVFKVKEHGKPFKNGDRILLIKDYMPCICGWTLELGKGVERKDVEIYPDNTDCAPVNGGKQCIKIVLKKDGVAALRQWIAIEPQSKKSKRRFWKRFDPEKEYVLSAWLKGSKGCKGILSLSKWKDIKEGKWNEDTTLMVNLEEKWKKYEIKWRGDPFPSRKGFRSIYVGIKGKGWIKIDNVVLYEADEKPFQIRKEIIDELKRMKPGCLRFWGATWDEGFENFLAHPLERQCKRHREFIRNYSLPNLSQSLKLCKEVGAVPWLIIGPSFTPEEWDSLLEFLNGPKESKYGRLRALLGHPSPWTDEFEKIYLELGNETWNWMFSPWVLQPPEVCAEFGNKIFKRVKSSKYYSRKIKLIINGWAVSGRWNGKVDNLCDYHDMIDITSYIGVKEIMNKNLEEKEIFKRILSFPYRKIRVRIEELKRVIEKNGKGTEIAIYESGPSYPLPGPGKPFDERVEYFMKSVAASIATLDSYLIAMENGVKTINFFSFNVGPNWATHTIENHKLKPYIIFTLFSFFNNNIAGKNLVKCEILNNHFYEVKIERGKKSKYFKKYKIPAVACYPLEDKNTYSIILINRSIDEKVE